MLLIALVFVAGGFLPNAPFTLRLTAWGFFGLGALVFAVQLLLPERLVLSRDGFSVKVMFRYFVQWGDVERFHIWANPAARQRLVGWNYLPGRKRETRLLALNRSLGAEACLPGMWTVKPDQLCALMNERLREAAGRTASP